MPLVPKTQTKMHWLIFMQRRKFSRSSVQRREEYDPIVCHSILQEWIILQIIIAFMNGSQIGKHIFDIIDFFLCHIFVGIDIDVNIDILFTFYLLFLISFNLIEKVIKHILDILMGTSTSSSSESFPTMSFSFSSIYFCLILAYSPSSITSCSFYEYFSCSLRWSVTLSRASIVSISMMAVSSWNFLSTRTFLRRVQLLVSDMILMLVFSLQLPIRRISWPLSFCRQRSVLWLLPLVSRSYYRTFFIFLRRPVSLHQGR